MFDPPNPLFDFSFDKILSRPIFASIPAFFRNVFRIAPLFKKSCFEAERSHIKKNRQLTEPNIVSLFISIITPFLKYKRPRKKMPQIEKPDDLQSIANLIRFFVYE